MEVEVRKRRVPLVRLGKTGLKLSKLGFGTFDLGPQGLNLTPEEGGRILAEAFRLGINFWDSSEDYGSHPHIASALQAVPRKEVVLSTKTDARSGDEARRSLAHSLKELGTDYLDIFFLHHVQSVWADGCPSLVKELRDVKATGSVKAIGVSTHSPPVLRQVSKCEDVDVVMTICCKADRATVERYRTHIPIEDGSIAAMLHETKAAHLRGKGTIAMKVLGTAAPPLIRDYRASIQSIANLNFVDAMVIGMKGLDEVQKDVEAVASG